jgi:glycosyltransferase involved in cell wall biosynthesis
MRSILFVAQIAPPSELVAARRIAGFSKYLSRLGYRVKVLTSRVSGEGGIDGAERVVRTSDLLLTRLNWRRGHFEAFSGKHGGSYAPPSVLERVAVPDLSVATWLPFALPAALRLAREQQIDCVITSSPPQSAHLVGLALKRRGLCWIADFRDGWTFEPQHAPWFTSAQRRADESLERRVARRADAVIGVTKPIADDLRERLGVRAELITNGFDPEEAVAGADGLLDPRRRSFVHTGRIAAARSTVRPLTEAIRRLRDEHSEFAETVEVVLAGPLSAEEEALVGAPDLDGVIRSVGALERPRALALQRAADALLVITEGSRRTSVATGKLFEYLAAARPVLVLGKETEAARIVAETGTGFATSADDPAAIADAIRQLADSPPEMRRIGVDEFAYPNLARRLADLVEDVCA